jgi:hypothetical protein
MTEFPDYWPSTDDPVSVNYIVEDGSNVAGSNSYATIAEADDYMNDYKSLPDAWNSALGVTDVQKQIAMIQGTQYVEDLVRGRFKGRATHDDQSMQWPRFGVTDESGYTFDHDEIPKQLKFAVFEAALRARHGTALVPDDTTGGGVKKERVKVGDVDISNEFFVAKTMPIFPEVTRKLKGLVRTAGMLSRA